jgi:uracil-DNA glycosylase
MGIDPAAVYLDYIVKCYGTLPTKKDARNILVNACDYKLAALQLLPNLKAVVVLGRVGCEWVTGGSILGDWAGADWPLARNHTMHCIIPKVWVGYSPGYALEKPSESGGIFRVLWKAAEEAGLNPTVTKIPPFEFNI